MRARGLTVVDRTGQRIGKLVVVKRVANKQESENVIRAHWLCKCDCGNSIIVSGQNLGRAQKGKGGTQSCGCLLRVKPIKHGKCGTKVYKTWHMMLQRCLNPNNAAYADYGGRGITVCEEWRDFSAFYADMGDPPALHTLDRTENSLGYNKDNCRWATKKEQGNNRRSNLFLTLNGVKKTLSQWADITGFTTYCIKGRIKAGWSVERALTTPMQKSLSNLKGLKS